MSLVLSGTREFRRGRRNGKLVRRWLGSAVCAAMLATPAIVIVPAPARASDSVFYVSGTRDNPAPQRVIDLSNMGAALASFGTDALQIGYPAGLFPLQGATGLDLSVGAGFASLLAALEAAPEGDRLVLIGVSQGDIVLSLVERALIASGSQLDVVFVRLAGPSGTTGVMGRNSGVKLPGLSFVTRPSESPFDQVVLNHEYDGLGHWPVHQLNALAVLNAVMGMLAFHNPGSYGVDLSTFPESDVTTTVNSLGATTTTYLIRATGLLPLLRPLQALGIDDALLSQWQRVLKPIIDSGYETSTAPGVEPLVLAMMREVVNSLSRMAGDVGTVLRHIEAARRPAAPMAIEASADGAEPGVFGAVVSEPEPASEVGDVQPALTGSPRESGMAAVVSAAVVGVGQDDTAAALDSAPVQVLGVEPRPDLQPVSVSSGGQDVGTDGSSGTPDDGAAPGVGALRVKSEDAAADTGRDQLSDGPRGVTETATARTSARSVGFGSEQRSPRPSLAPSGASSSANDDGDTSTSPRPRTASPSAGTDSSSES